MLFTQLSFFAFFAVCFAVHWTLRAPGPRKLWLLACSYFFYGWWDERFLLLILGATLVNWVAALRIAAERRAGARKAWVGASVATSLGVLGFFKYYGFFTESLQLVLAGAGIEAELPFLRVILPVGISFFTFQAMSYTIDVYRGELVPTRHFADFALYIAFFPQLVAGPIVRATTFLPQLALVHRFADIDIRRYGMLFLAGFFKKACVGDNLARAIDPVFAAPEAYGSSDLALAAVGYSIQIYCDFSGYSDMAIAIAGLLGYRLILNFDFPYVAANVQEFWRRWHISLSTWLRDYLYVPLGGSRRGPLRTQRNLLVTMLLGGLWHGAAMTFVVWGALHGLALLVHRAWHSFAGKSGAGVGGLGRVCGIALTFTWVVLCFTVFRSENLTAAATFLARLVSFVPAEAPVLGGPVLLLFFVLGAVHVALYRYRERLARFAHAVPDTAFSVGYGAAWSFVFLFVPPAASPFIYFQF